MADGAMRGSGATSAVGLDDVHLSPAGAAARALEADSGDGRQDEHQSVPQLYGKTDGTPCQEAKKMPTSSCATESTGAGNEEQAVRAARMVSVVSLLVSVIAASLGLGIGVAEEMLSLIGFGTEAVLDGLSSALVLWRFKRPKPRDHESPEAAASRLAERDARRERNSSIGIGATFLALSVLLLFSAGYKALEWDPDEAEHQHKERSGAWLSVMLSFPSGAVFGGLAWWKFSLARSLHSQVLRKDALCSVLGAVLAAIVAMAGLVEIAASNTSSHMAMVDAVASAAIALILGAEGGRTLLHNLPGGMWELEHRQMA